MTSILDNRREGLMKKIVVVVLLVLVHGIASAGMMMEFGLSGGRTLRGRIESQGAGIYTIRTEKGETISLPEKSVGTIHLIETGDASSAVPTGEEALRDAGALQDSMMRDDVTMELLRSLQDDPEMQRILADPALLAAVASGDLSALSKNPNLKQLLENPKVREIQRRLVAASPLN
jgi:hypothetical protein